MAEEKDNGVSAEAAQTYLVWHGLIASVVRREAEGSVAATLFRTAHEMNAGLGYGRR